MTEIEDKKLEELREANTARLAKLVQETGYTVNLTDLRVRSIIQHLIPAEEIPLVELQFQQLVEETLDLAEKQVREAKLAHPSAFMGQALADIVNKGKHK